MIKQFSGWPWERLRAGEEEDRGREGGAAADYQQVLLVLDYGDDDDGDYNHVEDEYDGDGDGGSREGGGAADHQQVPLVLDLGDDGDDVDYDYIIII